MPNVQAPAGQAGDDLRRRGRLLPALLPGAGDLHHRPVRAQPRRRGQLLSLRLVRDEGPRQHPAGLAPGRRLRHGADRQVAERLRSAATRTARSPPGFDIWRGLLDVSAYDYYNFVMNRDGKLRTWGDADFARKLVQFAKIEVTPNPAACRRRSAKLRGALRARRPTTTGAARTRRTTRPTSPARSPSSSSARSATKRKPFFIWWSPAAPHREDVSTTLMGRPGPDPRPAPRYADAEHEPRRCRSPRASTSPTSATRPRPVTDAAPPMSRRPDRPARARLPGPRRLAAGRRRPRRRAGQDPAEDRTSSRTR